MKWNGCPQCNQEKEQRKREEKLLELENDRRKSERKRAEQDSIEQSKMESFRTEQRYREEQLLEEQRRQRDVSEKTHAMLRQRMVVEEEDRNTEKLNMCLRAGLPYFSIEYQNAWADICRTYDRESRRKQMFDRRMEEIGKELWKRVDMNTLPPVVAEVLEDQLYSDFDTEELDSLYTSILRRSKKSLPEEMPSSGYYALRSAIHEILKNEVLLEKVGPNPPTGGCITTMVAFLATGVVCNTNSGGGFSPFQNNFWNIVLLWPGAVALLIIVLWTLYYSNRKAVFFAYLNDQERFVNCIRSMLLTGSSESIRGLTEESLREMTTFQEFKQLVGGSGSELDKKQLGKKVVLHEALKEVLGEIEKRALPVYFIYSLGPDSDSHVGRQISSDIGDAEEANAFLDEYSKLEEEYLHMRSEIHTIGDEVVRGIRIPEKRSIRLLKCISCGGLLSQGDNGRCPYCGSEYV